MIFVIDVGNTNMTMGVFQGKKLEATFRIMTKTPRTSDEYGIMITQLLKNNGIEVTDIEGVIIASVVPDVMHSLTSSIIRYLKTKPLIVGPGVKSGIKVATEDPRAIGADRIVDAVAAYVKYGGPVLVLDFGTATTYDLITEDGRFTAVSGSVQRLCGKRRRSCRILRSVSRRPSWHRRPLPVCRQDSCTVRSARRNTLSAR
jgi:type III pantothenate kinase